MNRTSLATLLALLLEVCVGRVLAQEAHSPAGVLGDYLKALKVEQQATFVSACQLNEHMKAVLIFKTGMTTGDFFIIAETQAVVIATTQGQVSIRGGTPTLSWLNVSENERDLYKKFAIGLTSWTFEL